MKPFRTLLAGMLVATVTTALSLLPSAAPASAAPSGPDLSRTVEQIEADLAEAPDRPAGSRSGTVTFRVTRDGSGAGVNAGPPTIIIITCVLTVFDPRVATQPTEVEATAEVECDSRVPAIVAGIALYRQGLNHSLASEVAASFFQDDVDVSTSTPCQTSGYFALATATVFFPSGFTPQVGTATVVSNLVLLAATGTAFPPFTCERPPQPTPEPPSNPPAPGPAPVANSVHCEYLGGSMFDCRLSASGWTHIRWTYNNGRIPGWDDKVAPFPFHCAGGTPTITAYVSNEYGTAIAKDRFRCEGQPL